MITSLASTSNLTPWLMVFLLVLEHPKLFLPQGLCICYSCCPDHSSRGLEASHYPPGLSSNVTSSERPSLTHLIQTGFLSLLPNQYSLLRQRKCIALP